MSIPSSPALIDILTVTRLSLPLPKKKKMKTWESNWFVIRKRLNLHSVSDEENEMMKKKVSLSLSASNFPFMRSIYELEKMVNAKFIGFWWEASRWMLSMSFKYIKLHVCSIMKYPRERERSKKQVGTGAHVTAGNNVMRWIYVWEEKLPNSKIIETSSKEKKRDWEISKHDVLSLLIHKHYFFVFAQTRWLHKRWVVCEKTKYIFQLQMIQCADNE